MDYHVARSGRDKVHNDDGCSIVGDDKSAEDIEVVLLGGEESL
jgi:hypothetical protein